MSQVKQNEEIEFFNCKILLQQRFKFKNVLLEYKLQVFLKPKFCCKTFCNLKIDYLSTWENY